ncbi:MAG: phospholipase D-like domain-containing protein [Bacteroidia bacterium]
MWRRSLGIYPFRYNNQLELLQSGNAFFEKMSELIKNAMIEIHFQLYIFEPDNTGKIIRDLLIEATKRGVKIYVVLDAYGSKNFNEIWQKNFENAGIEIYFYSPITFGNYLHMGMRLHHKIICVDGQFALVGGINISDNYSAYTLQTPWLDFALLTHGKVVNDLLQICKQTLRTVSKYPKFKLKHEIQNEHKPIITRVLQNNWVQAKFGITHQYKQKIRKSETEIILFISYFIPSISLKRLLKKAAKRGVNVNIVLSSISDVGIVKYATEYFYADMLKAGIKLYEWKQSVLHAKVALIDSNWLSVGSYNLNHLSDFGSIECNLEVLDESFCTSTNLQLKQLMNEGCESISIEKFEKRSNLFSKIFQAICYGLVRLSLGFMFLLQSRNGRKKRVY